MESFDERSATQGARAVPPSQATNDHSTLENATLDTHNGTVRTSVLILPKLKSIASLHTAYLDGNDRGITPEANDLRIATSSFRAPFIPTPPAPAGLSPPLISKQFAAFPTYGQRSASQSIPVDDENLSRSGTPSRHRTSSVQSGRSDGQGA